MKPRYTLQDKGLYPSIYLAVLNIVVHRFEKPFTKDWDYPGL